MSWFSRLLAKSILILIPMFGVYYIIFSVNYVMINFDYVDVTSMAFFILLCFLTLSGIFFFGGGGVGVWCSLMYLKLMCFTNYCIFHSDSLSIGFFDCHVVLFLHRGGKFSLYYELLITIQCVDKSKLFLFIIYVLSLFRYKQN